MQSLLQSLGVFFLFLIAILLLLVIGIAVFIALLIKSVLSSNVIYQKGQNYVDDTIKAIASNWNPEEIKLRATPTMLDSENFAQWHNYCLECEQNLGKLTNYRGSQGSLQGLPIFKDLKPLMRFTVKKSDLETLEASEKLILGEYIALADFEKGVAKFEIQILKQNEEWLINSLIITLNNSNFSGITEFIFGQKTTIQTLVEDNKKRLKLEKLL
jgi:hypothetical protein